MFTSMVRLPSGALLSSGTSNSSGRRGGFGKHGSIYENSPPKLEIRDNLVERN